MKNSFSLFLIFLLVILGFTNLKAQVESPIEVVHDPMAEVTLVIEKQMAKNEIIIKTKKNTQDISKWKVFLEMLKNAKQKVQDISQTSKFVKQMSQYKNIAETEINIIYAYEAMQKNVLKKRQFTESEVKLIAALYQSIFKDSNQILKETKNIFLVSNKLNMYDGSRIKLLQSQETKLKKLLSIAYAVNNQFGAESARRVSMYEELKKIKYRNHN